MNVPCTVQYEHTVFFSYLCYKYCMESLMAIAMLGTSTVRQRATIVILPLKQVYGSSISIRGL